MLAGCGIGVMYDLAVCWQMSDRCPELRQAGLSGGIIVLLFGLFFQLSGNHRQTK